MIQLTRNLSRALQPRLSLQLSGFCNAVSTKLSEKPERLNFYESLASTKLRDIKEVRSFLETISGYLPETKQEWIKTSHLLSSFFIFNYYSLNPAKDIEESRNLLEIAELWSHLYSHLEPDGYFQEDPCYWVWSAFEEEMKSCLREMNIRECIRIYRIFWANEKGSREFWDLLTWKFATVDEEEWKSQEVMEALEQSTLSVRLY